MPAVPRKFLGIGMHLLVILSAAYLGIATLFGGAIAHANTDYACYGAGGCSETFAITVLPIRLVILRRTGTWQKSGGKRLP